jgi:hypothetical protein
MAVVLRRQPWIFVSHIDTDRQTREDEFCHPKTLCAVLNARCLLRSSVDFVSTVGRGRPPVPLKFRLSANRQRERRILRGSAQFGDIAILRKRQIGSLLQGISCIWAPVSVSITRTSTSRGMWRFGFSRGAGTLELCSQCKTRFPVKQGKYREKSHFRPAFFGAKKLRNPQFYWLILQSGIRAGWKITGKIKRHNRERFGDNREKYRDNRESNFAPFLR